MKQPKLSLVLDFDGKITLIDNSEKHPHTPIQLGVINGGPQAVVVNLSRKEGILVRDWLVKFLRKEK
jgi:hypothetical protein